MKIMNIRLMFRVERAPHLVFKKVYNFRRNPISVSHKKKASLAHEELYHHVRTASMPEWARKIYLKETVFSRLNGLTSVAFYEPKSICDKNHPFLEQLKDDIKLSGYKMNLREWLMLNVKWQWMYKMFSFLVMVKNFTKYHLGLNN